MSLIQRLRKRLSWHKHGLEGSTVRGMTRCGGGASPTLPQRESAPDRRPEAMELSINSTKDWQDGLLGKILAGGITESKCSPLKGHCHGDFNAFREKVLKLVNRSSCTQNAPSTSRWK